MTAGKHDYLIQHIPKGKEHAISNSTLQDVLHLTRRDVSAAVLAARLDGIIIASDHHGYYIPVTDDELLQHYRLHHKQAVTLLASLTPVRRVLVKKGIKPEGNEDRGKGKAGKEQDTGTAHQ